MVEALSFELDAEGRLLLGRVGAAGKGSRFGRHHTSREEGGVDELGLRAQICSQTEDSRLKRWTMRHGRQCVELGSRRIALVR